MLVQEEEQAAAGKGGRSVQQGGHSPFGRQAAAAPHTQAPAPASAALRAWAAAHGAGGEATLDRRRRRARRNLVDVELGGLGWLAVAPVAVEGMWGWARTVSHACLGVAVARGVSVHARRPLLADTATGVTPAQWLE